MATFSKLLLSASTNGRPISVSATSSPGTIVHTGPSISSDIHEIWLYAQNYGTNGLLLVVQWGGTSSSDEISIYLEPYQGLTLITSGLLIKGAVTPLDVRAYCATANQIAISGYVNAITS